MEQKEALEKITDNLSQLLKSKNNLSPQEQQLIDEAQEIALALLND